MSRREFLARSANGFGAVALAGLWAQESLGRALATTHFPPKAQRVIFMYMDGGPSQVDTFDPKPLLDREHGKPFKMKIEPTQFNDNGAVFKSPWKFDRHGECGLPVSSLFPNVAKRADDLCVIRSMVSDFSEHTNANYFLHSGIGIQGRPSMGAWIQYGLGSECANLPGFIVLNGGLVPPGGLDNFTNGFLPATFQGSVVRAGDHPVAYVDPLEADAQAQAKKLDLMRRLDGKLLERTGANDALESAIANYELAFQMQSAVPELVDLAGESRATKSLYGLDSDYEPTRIFGRQCLIARRLVERGVRFIEMTCPHVGADRWDQHSNLKVGHENNARAVDQPIAGLLQDLKGRGLLDDTLVVWSGEFGRTPFAQGANGRDHNPFGFTNWLAGGGVRAGHAHGATDEYGYRAIEGRVTIHDLHATMLRLLGIDHKRLTFPFGGRDMRLTDVHGEVVEDVIG